MSLFRRLKYAFVAFFAALFSKPKVLESKSFYTRDGHSVSPDNLKGLTVEELAHSLSRISRLCGHTAGPLGYSLAMHSVYASNQVEDKNLALKVLMYDAYKSVTGDMSPPARRTMAAMGFNVLAFEYNMRLDMFRHFGIEPISKEELQLVDNIMLRAHASEMRDMIGVEMENPFDQPTTSLDPRDAAEAFVNRYNELRGIEVPKRNILS